MEKQNGYLILELLSDIELFFSEEVDSEKVTISDDEYTHCVKVFRKKVGDKIFITDGKGNIYNCIIEAINKKLLTAKILSISFQQIKYPDFYFCIPLLRNKDRLRFALEKLIELGITNLILYTAQRSVADKFNPEKFRKIAIETIKQSLLANLPVIRYMSSTAELQQLPGIKVIFDQKAETRFSFNSIETDKKYCFIFGPEGGLAENEIDLFDNKILVNLSENRLRTETAIIKVASIITQ